MRAGRGTGTGARAALLNARGILAELARDPAMLGAEILLPVFFLLLTAVGYSRESLPRTWTVRAEAAALEARPGLEEALRSARHPDGRPAFALPEHRAEGPEGEPLPSRGAAIVLRQGGDGSLILEGDAMSTDYVAASNEVEELLDGLEPARAGPVRLVSTAPDFRAPSSDFEAYVPGMLVFAALCLIPQTAYLIGRESRRRTLDRLAGAGMGAASYLGGVALSQSAFAFAQGLVLVGLSFALGYPFGPLPLVAAARALAIVILLSLGSVAQGLVVGAFAKSDSSAINAGFLVAMLQVFFSGSFFAMPSPVLFGIGHPGLASYAAFGAFDVFPATHAVRALTRTMLDGGRGVALPAAAMAGLTLAYFSGAALFFRRRFMRPR